MKAASLRRRNDVNGREPLLSLRKAAYDRLVELLEMGWPSLSRAERWHRGPLGRQLRSGRSNIYTSGRIHKAEAAVYSLYLMYVSAQ